MIQEETGTNIINFYYPIESVAEDIKMRTSYLGRFRRTGESAHLLDMLAFTGDERELFMSFIKSAMALIFPKISRMTKNITDAYEFRIVSNPPNTDTYANSVHYKVEWGKNLNPNYKQPFDQRMLDCISWYIIYRWLMLTLPESQSDIQMAMTGYMSALDDIYGYSNKRLNAVVNRTPRVF